MIFDYETVLTNHRENASVTYKLITSSLNELQRPMQVIGFMSRSVKIYHNLCPLFEVKKGIGENHKNDFEGTNYLNFYGTHLRGPILAKNPAFIPKLLAPVLSS